MLLATDGLSTPWAGVTAQENGVECAIFMRLGGAGNPVVADEASMALWSDVLIAVGDLVADGYRVLRDVQTNGAILFCRLAEDCRPMTRMALRMDLRSIEGLPFGPVSLIEATPLRENDLPGLDDDPWGTAAALRALETRAVPKRCVQPSFLLQEGRFVDHEKAVRSIVRRECRAALGRPHRRRRVRACRPRRGIARPSRNAQRGTRRP